MMNFIGPISFASLLLCVAVQSVKKFFFWYLHHKSLQVMGFEPTLFGRAKEQPQYAYQFIWQVPQLWLRHCSLSPQDDWEIRATQINRKNWDRLGVEHTPLEYRKSYTTICVIMLPPRTPSFMSLLPSIASPIQEKYWNIHWQILGPGELWTHTRRITRMCHCFMRNDMFP